ncbi:MAG: protein kinase [Muribaculaceae bacterium]
MIWCKIDEAMAIETSDFITDYSADGDCERPAARCRVVRDTDARHAAVICKRMVAPPGADDAQRVRDMLRKEYAVGRMLSAATPYVVRCVDFVDTPGECVLTLEYVSGDTLDALVSAEPDYFASPQRLHRFLTQLLQGLAAVHRHQVVHLDLKPSNIMLTRVNRDVRIIDFGLCYYGGYPSTMGLTAAYAAPEQLDGSADVDARTDIYAVGRLIEYIESHTRAVTPAARRRLTALKERCLAAEKSRRWQSADEMLRYLSRMRRRGAVAAVAAAAVMVAAAAMVAAALAMFMR